MNHVQNFSCVAAPVFRRFIFSILIFASAGFCRADGPASADTRTQSEIETSFLSQQPAVPESSFVASIKAFFQKTSLAYIFKKGGPIMWPLLFASVLALGTVMDRIFFLIYERQNRDRKALTMFFEAVRQADLEKAIAVSEASKFYVVRTLGYALKNKEKSVTNAMLYAREQEMKRFRRGIPALDTIITLAPLLGLLGTVTGMMGSFSLIGGELSTPGAITGGIAEALIATAFGLGIAITSLIPFNFLNTKMEAADMELESAATQLELLMYPQSGAVVDDAYTQSGESSGNTRGSGFLNSFCNRFEGLTGLLKGKCT